MSDYQRTTRICTLDDLPVPLAQALWQRALDQGIKDLAQEALIVLTSPPGKPVVIPDSLQPMCNRISNWLRAQVMSNHQSFLPMGGIRCLK